MNERERILELVKQGVLSTQEALDLLESAAKTQTEKQFQETPTVDDETTALWKQSAELEKNRKMLETQIAAIQTQLDQLQGCEETAEEVATLVQEQEQLVIKLHKVEQNQAELAQRLGADDEKQEKASFFERQEWQEQATEKLQDVGEQVVRASAQLGHLLKKTFKSVSDSVQENVEMKEFNVRVPGLAQTKFEHDFIYEQATATLLDIKVAHGNVTFKSWDEDTIKVTAKVKLNGKIQEDPLPYFEARSNISLTDERLVFHVPNKKVRAHLVFYLPKRMYDHVHVNVLHGNVLVEELNVQDIYLKATYGNLTFEKLDARMLEIDGVHGNIQIGDGRIVSTVIETVNGNVQVRTTPDQLSVSVVNGNVALTLAHQNLNQAEIETVNGAIKVALPEELAFYAQVKTNIGNIQSRLRDVVKEQVSTQSQTFKRGDITAAQLQLHSTSGSIYLKDIERKGEQNEKEID